MQLGADGFFHLTYCSKIHPGRGWEDLFANLRTYVPALKARLCPHQPFGLGLRLSDEESRDLLAGDRLAQFQAFLAEHDLYVFTLNGFPYGPLDGEAVKDQIFAPDWRQEARLDYTLRLIEILRRLLPPGTEGGISTIPLSYKPWMTPDGPGALDRMIHHLVSVTERLVRLREEEGKLIHLDLEPEPDGLLEHSREVVDFYRDWLLPVGGPLLAARLGVGLPEARRHLLAHLQVCWDTCHLAVEYEDAAAALEAFAALGLGVGRVQITAGLKVLLPPDAPSREALARQLEPFTRSPYLHQVSARAGDGSLLQFRDLGEALALLGGSREQEWRIHYHMPLFVDRYQDLYSTHHDTRAVLHLLRDRRFSRHLEIETYTWEWLPAGLKQDLLESLHREYLWVLAALGMSSQ
jgi:hypothetical protein